MICGNGSCRFYYDMFPILPSEMWHMYRAASLCGYFLGFHWPVSDRLRSQDFPGKVQCYITQSHCLFTHTQLVDRDFRHFQTLISNIRRPSCFGMPHQFLVVVTTCDPCQTKPVCNSESQVICNFSVNHWNTTCIWSEQKIWLAEWGL